MSANAVVIFPYLLTQDIVGVVMGLGRVSRVGPFVGHGLAPQVVVDTVGVQLESEQSFSASMPL